MALPMVRTRAGERTRRTNDRAVKGTGEDFTTTRTNEEGNEMKQIKLGELDKKSIEKAAQGIAQMIGWEKMPEGRRYWQEIHDKLCRCVNHGTNDGKPWVEPELTDEDAKQRPWVMCRDAHEQRWQGPYVLVCKTNEKYGFAAALPDFSELTSWNYCRLATAEEIEDANDNR
jgi:hypothetical protein